MTKTEYRLLHKWVEKMLGKPDTCEECSKTGLSGRYINWANISRRYKRDVTDWRRLCKKCHSRYDFGGLCRKRLHEMKGDNLYIRPNGERECKECRYVTRHNYYVSIESVRI